MRNTLYTVPTGPNLTESGPKLDPGFAFGVRSGSARVNPEQTPTGPRPDTKQTPSGRKANLESEPQFQKQTRKADPGVRFT